MTDNNKHIAITYSPQLIGELGGPAGFREQFFEKLNADDKSYWLTSINGIPQKYGDMVGRFCYIIFYNEVCYRASILDFKEGGEYTFSDGRSWEFKNKIMLLSAPVIEAPDTINMRGFQGFRYVNQIF